VTGEGLAAVRQAQGLSVEFSSRLRSFINRSIESVEHVEVLLLLKRDANRAWSAEEIAAELRRSPASVERRLRDLARSRLAQSTDERYRYQHGKHDETVDELEHEYELRRVRLIEAIFTGSIDSAQRFADAFRLWGEDDDR
jgi:DNA-directed RNA polymerase specialized sigma subunit